MTKNKQLTSRQHTILLDDEGGDGEGNHLQSNSTPSFVKLPPEAKSHKMDISITEQEIEKRILQFLEKKGLIKDIEEVEGYTQTYFRIDDELGQDQPLPT
jgi:hypothetical protein